MRNAYTHHEDVKNKHLKAVLEFFNNAHNKDDIPEDINETLKKGYELINLKNITQYQPGLLVEAMEAFQGSQEYDPAIIRKEKAEGKDETIMNMVYDHCSDEIICKYAISIPELIKFKHHNHKA